MTTTTLANPNAPYNKNADAALTTAGVLDVTTADWGLTEDDFGSLPVTSLFQIIGSQNIAVTNKILAIEANGSEKLSITTMFELQLKTQRLCQFSEMATSLTTAVSGCIQTMARNIK